MRVLPKQLEMQDLLIAVKLFQEAGHFAYDDIVELYHFVAEQAGGINNLHAKHFASTILAPRGALFVVRRIYQEDNPQRFVGQMLQCLTQGIQRVIRDI